MKNKSWFWGATKIAEEVTTVRENFLKIREGFYEGKQRS